MRSSGAPVSCAAGFPRRCAPRRPLNANVMPLEKAIEQSRRWMIDVATLVDGTTFDTTTRSKISVSLQHLSIEHHTGIHTLVDHGVLGSAFALFRPQFEAYVRGVWYHFCATEDDLLRFLSGSQPPHIDTLIEQLERRGAFSEGNLRRMKAKLGAVCVTSRMVGPSR